VLITISAKKSESFTGSFINFLFLNFIYGVNNFVSLLRVGLIFYFKKLDNRSIYSF